MKKFNEYSNENLKENYNRQIPGGIYWELAKEFVSYAIDNIDQKSISEMFESFEVDIRSQDYFDHKNHRNYLIQQIQTLCSNLHLNASELIKK